LPDDSCPMQETTPLLVVIDDEEDLLDLFEYHFRKQGFEVKVFNRAQPALAFCEKRRPDLIMCDWMMPEMDGLECCKRIKGRLSHADIPFVMVTCRSERQARRDALASGVTDYITKPIAIKELVSRVQAILTQNRPLGQA